MCRQAGKLRDAEPSSASVSWDYSSSLCQSRLRRAFYLFQKMALAKRTNQGNLDPMLVVSRQGLFHEGQRKEGKGLAEALSSGPTCELQGARPTTWKTFFCSRWAKGVLNPSRQNDLRFCFYPEAPVQGLSVPTSRQQKSYPPTTEERSWEHAGVSYP